MSDPTAQPTGAKRGRRACLLASLFLVPIGCGGNDDPTAPVAPHISGLSATEQSFGIASRVCFDLDFNYQDPDGDVPASPTIRFRTRFNNGEFYDQTWEGHATDAGAQGTIEASICHSGSAERISLIQDVSLFDAAGNESNVLRTTLSLSFSIPPAATTWLNAASVPLDGVHISLPHDDLEPLREIVGDARIVALGENTHGTRDFFEAKARILRFLVEEMDFDAFLIEATWPESNRLDDYVRTGVGDPEVYLSGLYFWTWRTESVLEMIEWMRMHNAGGGNVGFYGFDMQFPGMALHNVIEYVKDVDVASVPEAQSRLDCMTPFANDPQGRFPSARYEDAGTAYQVECLDSLNAQRSHLDANRATYVAASSERDFSFAQQSLRVAVQYHLMSTGGLSRDASMAENTEWWVDRLGPDSKVVLWAHNNHVSVQSGSQGERLRQTFGDEMVVIAFSHEEGTFTARTRQAGGVSGRAEHDLGPMLPGSFESFFATADSPRFLLDLRTAVDSGPESSWLAQPRPFRSIGAVFDPTAPDRYWRVLLLRELFDVVIHIEQTRATTVLTARYPLTFDPGQP